MFVSVCLTSLTSNTRYPLSSVCCVSNTSVFISRLSFFFFFACFFFYLTLHFPPFEVRLSLFAVYPLLSISLTLANSDPRYFSAPPFVFCLFITCLTFSASAFLSCFRPPRYPTSLSNDSTFFRSFFFPFYSSSSFLLNSSQFLQMYRTEAAVQKRRFWYTVSSEHVLSLFFFVTNKNPQLLCSPRIFLLLTSNVDLRLLRVVFTNKLCTTAPILRQFKHIEATITNTTDYTLLQTQHR